MSLFHSLLLPPALLIWLFSKAEPWMRLLKRSGKGKEKSPNVKAAMWVMYLIWLMATSHTCALVPVGMLYCGMGRKWFQYLHCCYHGIYNYHQTLALVHVLRGREMSKQPFYWGHHHHRHFDVSIWHCHVRLKHFYVICPQLLNRTGVSSAAVL